MTELARCIAAFAFAAVLGCGGRGPDQDSSVKAATPLVVEPKGTTMLAGSVARFFAGDGTELIQWSVSSDSDGGSIDATGMFTAPMQPGAYVIHASRPGSDASALASVSAAFDGGTDLTEQHFSSCTAASAMPLRIHAIVWGDPAALPPDGVAAVESLLRALPGSDTLAIADQYLGGVRADITFAGTLFDPDHAPTVADPQLPETTAEICRALHASGIVTSLEKDLIVIFPSRPSGPPGDVNDCGWHSFGVCPDGNSFIINLVDTPASSNGVCTPLVQRRARGCSKYSIGAELMTRVATHELFESITNAYCPDWLDLGGEEIADKCDDYDACVSLGGDTFYVQALYSNAQHGCVIR